MTTIYDDLVASFSELFDVDRARALTDLVHNTITDHVGSSWQIQPVPADGALAPAVLEAGVAALAESAGEEVLVCSRSWDAWSHGTMTDADFTVLAEDVPLAEEIVTAVARALAITKVGGVAR